MASPPSRRLNDLIRSSHIIYGYFLAYLQFELQRGGGKAFSVGRDIQYWWYQWKLGKCDLPSDADLINNQPGNLAVSFLAKM